MKIFISGPIENVAINRLRKFDEIKKYFESNGYEVISEIDIPYPELVNGESKMVEDCPQEPEMVTWLVLSLKKIWMMTQCDALLLLPDWQECHASSMMFITARKLGMPTFEYDGSAIKLANEDEVKNWFERQM